MVDRVGTDVLRAVARHHDTKLDALATVVRTGVVRVGDPLELTGRR